MQNIKNKIYFLTENKMLKIKNLLSGLKNNISGNITLTAVALAVAVAVILALPMFSSKMGLNIAYAQTTCGNYSTESNTTRLQGTTLAATNNPPGDVVAIAYVEDFASIVVIPGATLEWTSGSYAGSSFPIYYRTCMRNYPVFGNICVMGLQGFDVTTGSGDTVVAGWGFDIKGPEQCDNGIRPTPSCDTNCTYPECGDEVLNLAASEECDDGKQCSNGTPCIFDANCAGIGDGYCRPRDGDGCSATCQSEAVTPVCGNGTVEAGETCDDGNTVTEKCAYGQTSCLVCNAVCQEVAGETSYCGDYITDTGNGEQCDDGGTVNGDGCDSTCQIEAICGNGIVEGDEQCDFAISDMTPQMSSNTSPSPYAVYASTIYSTTYDGWKAFDHDWSTNYSRWSTSNLGSYTQPEYLRFDFGSGNEKMIRGLTFRPYSGQVGDFTILGSNDASSWTSIYSNTHPDDDSTQTYYFPNDNAYRYYMFRADTAYKYYRGAYEIYLLGAEQYESYSCDSDCTYAECGDGVLNETAGEECDDGNYANGDGCDSSCQIEGGAEPELKNKIYANDAYSGDYFGYAVDIDGDYAVVGAYYDDSGRGAAYVFEKNANDNWNQVAKLTASDRYTSDYFGMAVSISGDYVIVGAYYDDDGGSSTGSAYIFEKPVGGWTDMTQTAKLTAFDRTSYDYFGISVAVDGNVAVVGSYGDDDGGYSYSGSAYVYERTSGSWGFKGKLRAGDAYSSDYFGYSVSISGDNIVVGAYGDGDKGSYTGSAYIFEKPVGG
jgi:cysteine-rich repeat protein